MLKLRKILTLIIAINVISSFVALPLPVQGCVGPFCGDGTVDQGEECDAGPSNGIECIAGYGSECQYCTGLCAYQTVTGPYCGNGTIESPEECDDGNVLGGDGCSATCTTEEQPYCELELTKTDNVDPIEPGEEIIYHLTLENIGTADCTGTGVRIEDVFDLNTTYVSSSITPEEVTDTYVKWNVGTLHPGNDVGIDLTMNVLENTPCGTILENKAKYWSNQTNWGNFVTEETTVECPPTPEYVTIYGYKVVCDHEEYLPNWGDGQDVQTITEQVITDFVAQNSQHCHLEAGWDFQWGRNGEAQKQNGNHVGPAPAGTGWNDFDSSTGVSPAQVILTAGDLSSTSQIWVKENLKQGYIPFSNPPGDLQNSTSAEMYCYNDVLNYDNYDYISNPQLGEEYYCAAFNALASNTEPYCELELTKTDNADPVEPGDEIVYHLTLENTGTADCTGTGVRIKDVFDQNTTYVSSSRTPEETTATYIKWNVGTLHPGDEVEIDLTMQVSEETQCGTVLENKAKYWSNQTNWGDFVTEETTVECLPPPICQNVIAVSNTDDDVFDATGTYIGKAVATYNLHPSWTAVIDDATWIWKSYLVENPTQDETYVFSKDFDIIGVVSSSTLKLAADNTYKVWINDVLVGQDLTEYNYTHVSEYVVTDKLHAGTNNIKFEIMNMALAGSTPESNPAGLLYKLDAERSSCQELIVIDDVVGGTATSGSFTVYVSGNNPLPASFPGKALPGTIVTLDTGAYNVTQSTTSHYLTAFSPDCNNTIVANQVKTCTITNTYEPYCGDEVCNGTENCSTCSEDCGPCPETNGTLYVIDNVVGGTATSGAFTVYVSGNSPLPASFPGQVSPGTLVTLHSGIYNVTESTSSEYTTSFSANCSSTMAGGETKTCTITNTLKPYCGDGTCSGDETCVNCSKDCGGCGGGCTVETSCSVLGCGKTDSCGTFCGSCGGGGGGESYCGDGTVNAGEQCDKTIGVPEGYTCTASCTLEKDICNMDLNVVMVMDVSGSMGYESPTKLSLAKIAANSFIDNLRSSDKSGVVSFSWTAALNKGLSNDHASTKSVINGLTANGATNIGDAIDKANKELISVGNSSKIYKVEILLTDGKANQPNGNGFEENPNDLALALDKFSEAAKNGITIFTIGLGADVNKNMLQNMAENTGGKYYFAPSSNDLIGIFNQIASETCKVSTTSSTYVSPSVVIFNPTIRNTSNTSAVVSWYTNVPATSRVVYGNQQVSVVGEAPNYGYAFSTLEQDSTNKVIFHSVTLNGLTPGRTYYWRPISSASPEVLGQESSFVTKIAEESPLQATSSESATGSVSFGPVYSSATTSGNEVAEGLGQGWEEKTATSNEGQGFFAFLANGLASIITAFRNLLGRVTYLGVILIIIILVLLFFLLKKRKKEENKQSTIQNEIVYH